MNITCTEKAAQELATLLETKGDLKEKGLRLSVKNGGCAGMRYEMKIDSPQSNDIILTKGNARLFIDRESASYLKGCEIDYSDSLSDSGFKINNPNATRNCGCGASFEANEQNKNP